MALFSLTLILNNGTMLAISHDDTMATSNQQMTATEDMYRYDCLTQRKVNIHIGKCSHQVWRLGTVSEIHRAIRSHRCPPTICIDLSIN